MMNRKLIVNTIIFPWRRLMSEHRNSRSPCPALFTPAFPIRRSVCGLISERVAGPENSIHKGLALSQLFERHEFVRSVCLGDVAGSADDTGHTHGLKQSRLSAVRHLAHRGIVR